jgi:hypothetical protein
MTPNNTSAKRHIEQQRVSRTTDLSPESYAARNTLQTSGFDSKLGSQQFDFTSNSGPGWGQHDGGTKVDTGPAESPPVYNWKIIENPLSLALLGENCEFRIRAEVSRPLQMCRARFAVTMFRATWL